MEPKQNHKKNRKTKEKNKTVFREGMWWTVFLKYSQHDMFSEKI